MKFSICLVLCAKFMCLTDIRYDIQKWDMHHMTCCLWGLCAQKVPITYAPIIPVLESYPFTAQIIVSKLCLVSQYDYWNINKHNVKKTSKLFVTNLIGNKSWRILNLDSWIINLHLCKETNLFYSFTLIGIYNMSEEILLIMTQDSIPPDVAS